MKLLTLNLHNLPLTWGKAKMDAFAKAIEAERPDVIALQEVFASTQGENDPLSSILSFLKERGANYYGVWKPIKIGYGIYREGMAILSTSPITAEYFSIVSDIEDENDWKKRGIIGVSVEKYPDQLFFSVHYGWWGDAEEPFARQWAKTVAYLAPYREKHRIWLMGDFNNPAHRRGEGYDRMIADGWQDAYLLASHREGEATVAGEIDGWQGDERSKRIDLILTNRPGRIAWAKVIFDGQRYPAISDHYGLCVQLVSEEDS